ncbi:MAG: isoprenylcysteine carboxylmethyltransferase family protein [Chloroflexota bacterium]|nr:isoprenylcysteine carboxylmethyltransferase family protein [Chloroflexota bacterium]
MTTSILLLSLAFVAWAGLHSLLAAFDLKSRARRRFGPGADRWYRLAYNVISALTLLPLFLLLAALPDKMLYSISSPWNWFMRAGQALALLGLLLAFLQTNPAQFLGLSQLANDGSNEAESLVIHGFYCRVRHPLYFFSILLVWLTPTMTINWLLACILITLYFYLGSLHEERRLLAEFGDAYADYQCRVPMLIPRPGRCVPPTQFTDV